MTANNFFLQMDELVERYKRNCKCKDRKAKQGKQTETRLCIDTADRRKETHSKMDKEVDSKIRERFHFPIKRRLFGFVVLANVALVLLASIARKQQKFRFQQNRRKT